MPRALRMKGFCRMKTQAFGLRRSLRKEILKHWQLYLMVVPHIVGEGDSLLMPANIPHAVKPLGGFKMLLVMIKEKPPAE